MRFKSQYITPVLILCLLLALVPLQSKIRNLRQTEGLSENIAILPGEMVSGIIMSGFRGIAADILWLRCDMYFHHGQWYKLLPLYRTITFLQPHFIQAWAVAGWHMAYNIYHEAPEEDKQKWLEAGINFLKTGIGHNPDRYDLYFELGWTYFHKAEDYANAVIYFKKATEYEHPDYIDRMVAHAYEKNGELKKALEVWQELQKKGTDSETTKRIFKKSIKRLCREVKKR